MSRAASTGFQMKLRPSDAGVESIGVSDFVLTTTEVDSEKLSEINRRVIITRSLKTFAIPVAILMPTETWTVAKVLRQRSANGLTKA